MDIVERGMQYIGPTSLCSKDRRGKQAAEFFDWLDIQPANGRKQFPKPVQKIINYSGFDESDLNSPREDPILPLIASLLQRE